MHALQPDKIRSRVLIAVVLLAAALLAPGVMSRGFLLTFLTQVAITSVLAMSYNMLLGQAGLLSFGHAVYSGIGAYCAIHVINRFGADGLGLGMIAVPLVGAAGGSLAGLLFGYFSTRRSGTVFAMITLGVAEMIVAVAAMLPGTFGGENGISTNRMLSTPVLGLDFGSANEIYCLALAWSVIAGIGMYAFTRTPLGRLANAVRDNPERVAFVGFNPGYIRLTVMVLAGGFAGVAGGMSVLNYELVTAENLGIAQSGMVLIATYLGGVGHFIGPVIGAFVFVLFLSVISTWTDAWLLYFGMLFILIVLFAPQGIAELLISGAYRRLRLRTAAMATVSIIVCIAAVESVYAWQDESTFQIAEKLALSGKIPHYLAPAVFAVAVIACLGYLLMAKRRQVPGLAVPGFDRKGR